MPLTAAEWRARKESALGPVGSDMWEFFLYGHESRFQVLTCFPLLGLNASLLTVKGTKKNKTGQVTTLAMKLAYTQLLGDSCVGKVTPLVQAVGRAWCQVKRHGNLNKCTVQRSFVSILGGGYYCKFWAGSISDKCFKLFQRTLIEVWMKWVTGRWDWGNRKILVISRNKGNAKGILLNRTEMKMGL